MKIRIATGILCIAFSAIAQTSRNGLTIPEAHPRLWWTADRLAQAQNWVAKTHYAGLTATDRPLDMYDVLFTCYVMNVQAACTAVLNNTVAFNPDGATPGSCTTQAGCDAIRVYGEGALLGYDWVYSKLTESQRSAFVSNWNTWMTNQKNQTWGNENMPGNDYHAGKHRNFFTLGVVTYGDNPTAGTWLDYWSDKLWPALVNYTSPTGTGPIGGRGHALLQTEGSEYGKAHLAYQALVLPEAHLMGRNLWSETTAFKAAVLHTIYNTMPKKTASRGWWDTFPWSDDEQWDDECRLSSHAGPNRDGGCAAANTYYGNFMQTAVNELSNTGIGKLARQWISTVQPAINVMLQAADPGGEAQSFSALPLDYYASGPQTLYIRSNWTPSASALNIQGGIEGYHTGTKRPDAVGHNHQDFGSWQWFRNGSFLLRETVGYVGTIAGYNSVGTAGIEDGLAHNVPLIGGKSNVRVHGCTNSNSLVRRLESEANYVFLNVDISGTYRNNICDEFRNVPDRENPYALHVERDFLFLRDIEVMVIVDRLQADTPSRSKTFTTHCEKTPAIQNANHFTCTVDGQKAVYTVLAPTAPTTVVVNESANNAQRPASWQQRIEVTDPNPGTSESYFLTVVQGMDADQTAASPTVVDNGASWTITVDATHIVTLQKGMASAGGSVTVNGAKKALSSGKMSMTIGDDGPVWSAGPGNRPVRGRAIAGGSAAIR
jgi:hypothetical protein